jgi:hypothetical protein
LLAARLDFVHAKNIIQRLNDVQDAASHRCDSRLRRAGNVIERQEHMGDFREF